MILDNIALKPKLLGGFCVMILIAVIISVIGFFSMGIMAEKADKMYSERLVALDGLMNADTSFLNIRVNIYKTVFANDERIEKFAEVDAEVANIKDKIAAYQKNATTEKELNLLSTFNTNWPIFENSLRKVIENMKAGNEESALTGIYSEDFKTPRDAAQDAIDQLEIYNQEQSRILKDDITKLYQESSLIFLFITLFALIFGLSFAFILTNSITSPLGRTMNMIQEMGKGHLGMRLKMTRNDEVGRMAYEMDNFADILQTSVIGIMKRISIGEKISNVPIIDDCDEIGPALKATVDTINNLISETKSLTEAAIHGELSKRGDETKFLGAYKEIITGINTTLENIVRPVNESMKLAGMYARGDFSKRFSDSVVVSGDFIPFKQAMDTIGKETGVAISLVVSEVMDLMSGMEEVNASIEEISAGAHNLAQNASQVSGFSESSLQSIQQILDSMDDLSVAVTAVATDTNGVANLAQNTDLLADEGTRIVGKTESGMENIKKSFQETSLVITEINQQMKEIGSIVDVIGGIAEQTNLLALNAAIEAARAGEAGMGFAVVADEVKDLAEESRTSTDKIANLISDLQKKSNNVTLSMDRSLNDVTAGDVAVKEILGVFEKIAADIAEITKRMNEVAGTTEEQAASVQEISVRVHDVGSLVEKTAKEAVDSSAATEQASAALDQITQVIGKATVSVGHISGEMNKFII
ncbi:HAMP domain-containing methyl-accepting chemotaxis protein [Methanospirillum lacunae]|uniref:Methyl-accepting chemotaxis protein n=1 Tax=Methanospirillum lacunae TaxID=668570 RepID=A0A2V2N2E4_9EURY|nr:methyl-accepting chemotaxis protein [Methanospirillum lacunae]PWR74292.1 methyl-accepting chemotaxis protein [Methanospirillum lacunae]